MKIKYNRFGKITKIIFDNNETPFLLSENFKSAEGGDIPINEITAMMMKQRTKFKRNKQKKDVSSIYGTFTYGVNKDEYYSFILKKS